MRMAPGAGMGSSLLGKRTEGSTDADLSKMPAEHVYFT
jgi:hypothetical protein